MLQAISRGLSWLVIILSTIAFSQAVGEETTSPAKRSEQEHFFENTVRPLLIQKCLDCHAGDDTDESSFAIASREHLLKGANFGPSILPGRSQDSVLIRAVKWTHKELRMPPDENNRLSREEISVLARWIDDGAVWPRTKLVDGLPEAELEKQLTGKTVKTDHWSFKPRKLVPPPKVDDARWAGHEIDRFIQNERRKKHLTAVREADRRTLIRRITFNLTGLPPTPTEIKEFVADPRSDDDAWRSLINRLLRSPHYGERWGRHWLDVARYADTQGDVGDIPIPDAWRYRNWVIDALNADMPFDTFLQAQIAGDVLARKLASTSEETESKTALNSTAKSDEVRNLVVATGFISLSQRFGNSKTINCTSRSKHNRHTGTRIAGADAAMFALPRPPLRPGSAN